MKAWDRSAHDVMLHVGRLLIQSNSGSPITSVLGTSSVLDVVTIALFTLHDAVDGARGGGRTRGHSQGDVKAPALRARNGAGRCSRERRGRACSC
jgi:hypothetical protein